jgi:hypothetical protein
MYGLVRIRLKSTEIDREILCVGRGGASVFASYLFILGKRDEQEKVEKEAMRESKAIVSRKQRQGNRGKQKRHGRRKAKRQNAIKI